MNNVILVGRLTQDPELKTTPNNVSVVNFALAVRRDSENTDFIDCVAWKGTADIVAKYCNKGSQLGIVGKLQKRKYESKGNTIYVTEVIVESVELLGSKNENKKPYEKEQIETVSKKETDKNGFEISGSYTDDLPFF